jgi:dinuclear metal center YbgI/SA1388 family protein
MSFYEYLYYSLLPRVIIRPDTVFIQAPPYSFMHIGAFIQEMEQLAPPDLAEEFDAGKIGLVVEGKGTVRRICCALDATPAVVKKAARFKADMLVVHHTPIWNPVTQVTGRTADVLRMVLAADMNLYVMHTNFDRAEGGVNDALCDLLSLSEITPLTLGRTGKCSLTLEQISGRLACTLRIWGKAGTINRLAVVAGSGFVPELIGEAAATGADAFLSAEMKHSVARAAPIPCIEATHYALEAPAMKALAARYHWKYLDDPPRIQSVP